MSGISECAQSVLLAGLESFGPFERRTTPDMVNHFAFTANQRHADALGKVARSVLAAFTQGVLEVSCQAPESELNAVIVSLVCDFVADGAPGERIEAEVKEVRRTNSLVFLTADVTANRRILLTANALAKRP